MVCDARYAEGAWVHHAQSQVAELQSASCAEFEEVRHEGSSFIQLLASHVREAAAAADGATRRVGSVEQDMAAAVEEMHGRFEALATMPSELAQLRCQPACLISRMLLNTWIIAFVAEKDNWKVCMHFNFLLRCESVLSHWYGLSLEMHRHGHLFWTDTTCSTL